MRLVSIVVAYSMLPLMLRELMFGSSSPEDIPLRADPEELGGPTQGQREEPLMISYFPVSSFSNLASLHRLLCA